jgi:hypothetical protein
MRNDSLAGSKVLVVQFKSIRSVSIEGVMHWNLGKREIDLAGEKDARRDLEVKYSGTKRSLMRVTCG